jgi:hypothetical protein
MANEAGIRALRANFIRETVPGVTDADPDWLRFSDELDSATYAPEGNIFERRAIGSPDVTGFELGPEAHEMSIVYSMQRWLVGADPQPNPLDPAADGLLRDANGGYLSTHSVLTRQEFATGGTDGNGFRIYSYGTGGFIGVANVSGAPDSGDPSKIELSYNFERARSHLINQMAVQGGLTIVSSSALDVTQTVTIENEGAGVSETIALNGTTPVVGVTLTFDDVDAIALDAATEGDITITFTTGGLVCMVIEGKISNNDIEGDLGLPLLGAGSFETALGFVFQTVLNQSVSRGGSPVATNVMGISFEVTNNLQQDAVVGSRQMVISPGNRDMKFNASVFSDRASHDDIVSHLQATELDMVWTFFGGATAREVTMTGAALTAPGERSYQKGEATMSRDNEFTAQTISISDGL